MSGQKQNGLSKLVPLQGRSLAHNPEQFHATAPAGTFVLVEREGQRLRTIGKHIWEPACGSGDMARVLSACGFDVVATELMARGFGEMGVDFLATRALRAPIIITNPPFGEAACDFIRHAAELEALYLALLLPVGFFQPTAKSKRDLLWREFTPTRVWPLGFRLDFTGAGRPPAMPLAWFVWDWTPGLSGHHDRKRIIARQVSRDMAVNEPYARWMPPVSRAAIADLERRIAHVG